MLRVTALDSEQLGDKIYVLYMYILPPILLCHHKIRVNFDNPNLLNCTVKGRRISKIDVLNCQRNYYLFK